MIAHRHESQRGVTLVEVMIAMLVGLILLAGITTLVVNASRSNRDIDAAARQLENGRYAASTLIDHLRHAGFWGNLYANVAPAWPMIPDPAPNPCPGVIDAAVLETAMPLHIQGENNPAGAPTAACLSDAEHVDGTDILVVRRAATLDAWPTFDATTHYIQSSPLAFEIDVGANADIIATEPDQQAFGVTIEDADGDPVRAAVRAYRIEIFYVSPNTVPADPCNVGGASEAIPTLMLMRLDDTDFCAEPIAVGIEDFQVEYGIDANGDGAPNGNYTDAPAATVDWTDVMGVRVYLLARSTTDVGAQGGKTYVLGEDVPKEVVDPGDGFSRHVFSATARLVNPSGRREQP